MIVLGINGGVRLGYQDVSAAIVVDGKPIAAIEEERLNRKKHSAGQLPYLSIHGVLHKAGLKIEDVDVIASHGATWGEEYSDKLKSYFKHSFGHCPRIERVHHHDCHAASAYYASGFDEAMVLTVDASGDGVSTQMIAGKGSELELKERISRPDSLGIYYSIITQYCGFLRDSDEYKLMGLASYGDANKYDLSDILCVKGDSYSFNEAYIKPILPGQGQPTRQEMAFSDKLIGKLGPKRLPGAELNQHYKDVAAAAQHQLEEMLIHLVTKFHEQTGLRKLCLAGGVALNCVANQKLMNLHFIDDVYIQPAAGDNGLSLGAAYLGAAMLGDKPQTMDTVYLGNDYDNANIQAVLKTCGLRFEEVDDVASKAAHSVAEGKVIGWFQGGMEYGPRALGARSILASATDTGMQDKVNAKIKFRESFRPFCPSVLEEDSALYFEGKQAVSPYMTITYDVKDEMRSKIPAVTHIDGTARIQTVNQSQHRLYYEYLTKLKGLTGHGVSLNTSFNVANEPIVCSPRDAIATFFGSGMDELFLGNFHLTKSK